MEVEDVAARKLLACCDMLAADDAHAIGAIELLLGGIWEAVVHVVGDAALAHEISDAGAEGANGQIQVAQDVQR